MYGSIFRFRVIYSLILCIVAFDLAASPCFSNGSVTKDTQKSSKLSRNRDCNEIDSNSRKSVSERITDSVAEKQKINQQIMQIELKLSLLRARKGNMQESEYQRQMSELTSQRAKLKRLSSIN
ncbi:hypothetical protein [Citrobacter werkmanii]|uniref:hypothetical protein n=1 Tax=Citrobacter werkmanii TaxID=67827 RepID=UPI001D08BF93|nr:hypothetical protein [Citrobacter werkmanii]UCA27542.1 hypothetical protein LA356_23625 [Citrobacter werkmanii]